MDGWDWIGLDWIGLDWILLRTLVQLEHLAVLKMGLLLLTLMKTLHLSYHNLSDIDLQESNVIHVMM